MSDTTGSTGTEAHGKIRMAGPAVEVEAHGCKIRWSPETEAQAFKVKWSPETESHGFSMSPADPALDAHAHIRLTFPAGAPEQTLELRYRPSATPGEPPEVELHGKMRMA